MPGIENRPAAGKAANNDNPARTSGPKRTPGPKRAPESTGGADEELEQGLKDSFPASDPVSATAPGSKDRPTKVDPVREGGHERDDQLDDGLMGTFPASDPISVTSSSTRTGRPVGKG